MLTQLLKLTNDQSSPQKPVKIMEQFEQKIIICFEAIHNAKINFTIFKQK